MTFNSTGHACQYLIDTAGLTIEQINEYTRRTGLTELHIANAAAFAEENGKDIQTHLNEQIRAAEQQQKEYQLEDISRESAAAYLQEFADGISEAANTPSKETGFSRLDQILDHGLYEGLYIFAAIPSLGKTTFVIQIADQLAAQGYPVIIFSLEMSRFELMAKSVSRQTLLQCLQAGSNTAAAKTARGITDGQRYQHYSDEERELIYSAITEYGRFANNIYILEGIGDIGTDQIRETLQRYQAAGIKAIPVIDYMQILAPHDIRATDKVNTDRNVIELRRISRDFKIPVMTISSFNRSGYSKKASFEALKESGGLEYGADVIIGLNYRGIGAMDFDISSARKRQPREIEAEILKNRNGRTGDKICFEYYPQFNYFREVDAWN